MMAQPVPHHPNDGKRVKVYELRENDWHDRGTGFCAASFVEVERGRPKEPRVIVQSEDQPERTLLESRINKEDSFQKQQETLIVWTETSLGTDLALSFQEAGGCRTIWDFITNIQKTFQNTVVAPVVDDSLSDDLAMDMPAAFQLPQPTLANLIDLETNIRMMSSSATGREALVKTILTEDYIQKLIPLVEEAEDFESLQDLHRLCNIMKTILLLNDTSIIEHAVSDECVLGVVGALEYDPDFPSHKANHRQWLNNQGRYKEVVRIEDDRIRQKIHHTYRLQYLKDVVLARILDDPTFSILNSLIFFNQVEIVQHLQSNGSFLRDLFAIFQDRNEVQLRKKEAVLFIQQCCAIGKNLQPPGRESLYNNFLSHGLLQVINFGLRNGDVSVRVGATDILVSMIDHDPMMIRQTIFHQIQDGQPPLIDTLIELLLVEVDLGVKSQVSDALKVLLDPSITSQIPESFVKANGEVVSRMRQQTTVDPQQERVLEYFYKNSAVRLFKPLLDLDDHTPANISVLNDSIFSYLNEILGFYIRQHNYYIKHFIREHRIAQRFAQLLSCKEKHLQLVAIRFFRQLVVTQDEVYISDIAKKQVLGPILDLLLRIMPRDNLLSSACLELFELIRKEHVKPLIKHLVEEYRVKMTALAYMDTFRDLLGAYDQTQGFTANMEHFFMESEEEMGRRPNRMHPGAMMEHAIIDPIEDEYFNTSDGEEEAPLAKEPSTNGASPARRPLVDYASDEEDNVDYEIDMATEDNSDSPRLRLSHEPSSGSSGGPPPERISEKRRREEEDDEDDEMSRLIQQHKRRNSSSGSLISHASSKSSALRGKKSAGSVRSLSAGSAPRDAAPHHSNGHKKASIAISLSPSLKGLAAATPHQSPQRESEAVDQH